MQQAAQGLGYIVLVIGAHRGGLKDLTFLELFLVLVAMVLWGEHFWNKHIVFWCENHIMVRLINQQSFCSEWIMHLVYRFVLACLGNRISFSEKYVAGTNNYIKDMLSQFQKQKFLVFGSQYTTTRRLIPGGTVKTCKHFILGSLAPSTLRYHNHAIFPSYLPW